MGMVHARLCRGRELVECCVCCCLVSQRLSGFVARLCRPMVWSTLCSCAASPLQCSCAYRSNPPVVLESTFGTPRAPPPSAPLAFLLPPCCCHSFRALPWLRLLATLLGLRICGPLVQRPQVFAFTNIAFVTTCSATSLAPWPSHVATLHLDRSCAIIAITHVPPACRCDGLRLLVCAAALLG